MKTCAAMAWLRRAPLPLRPTLLLLIALCAGCASSPPVRFHTLLPATLPQPVAAAVPDRAAVLFVLAPVKVPASVDQPQWLVRLPDESLALLEQDRWASPLGDELHAALGERLHLRFGLLEAQTARERQAAPARIELELTRFESIPGHEVRIEASWTSSWRATAGANAAVQRCSLLLEEPVGSGIAALGPGYRRVVARLGDAIGEQVLALQRGAPTPCAARTAAG